MSAQVITEQSTVTISINLSFRLVRAFDRITLRYYAVAIRNLIVNTIMGIPKRILPVREDNENARLYLVKFDYHLTLDGEELSEIRIISQDQEQDRMSHR